MVFNCKVRLCKYTIYLDIKSKKANKKDTNIYFHHFLETFKYHIAAKL